MIDTVLLDLDGTLLTYERPREAVLAAAFDRAGVEPFFTAEEYAARFESHLPAESVADLRRRTVDTIARERDVNPDRARRVAAAYTDERDPRNVRLIDGAGAVLDRLARDHRLGMVTNGPREYQRAKVAAVGIADAFERIVYAGAETAPKPDTEPFEVALSALDADPGRAVHVGNSLASDVAGARRAGLRATWVPAAHDDPEPEPDDALPELTALLDPPWR